MTNVVADTNITSQDNPFASSRMIVVGVLPYDGEINGFVPSIPRGAAGGAHILSPAEARSLLGALADENEEASAPKNSRGERLTPRERQVFERISEGLSNKQIATRLGIAIHTVKCHVHNILSKLEVDNRVQIAVFGRREGVTC